MDTLQNSRLNQENGSSKRRLDSKNFVQQVGIRSYRQAANLSVIEVSKALGAPLPTVEKWDRGASRPRLPWPIGLAQFFKCDLDEMLTAVWGENQAQLCNCGCGNPKVLPDRDGAQHLYTKLVCTNCGNDYLDGTGDPIAHRRKLCLFCYCTQGRGTKLRCVGFPWNGVDHWARSCRRRGKEKSFSPSRLKRRSHRTDDGRHAFVDLVRGECRCRDCAGALIFHETREKQLRYEWSQSRPSQNFPVRIRTLNDLRRAQRVVFKELKLGEKMLMKRKRGSPRKRKRGTFSYPKRLPMWLQGLCEICGTFLPSDTYGARFHPECLRDDQSKHRGRRRGYVPETPRRRAGGQKNLDVMRRNLHLTIRHKFLHEPLRQIAKDFRISKRTVQDAMESTLDLKLLPNERLVAPPFKPLFAALRSFARGAPVRIGYLRPHAFRSLIQPYASAKK